MPSFIVVSTPCRVGQMVPASHCDLNAAGGPDKRSGVPVNIRVASEKMLFVDDEPRQILQAWGGNGKTSYLIRGSTQTLRDADRRRELARGHALLRQVRDCLLPLKADSEDPGLLILGCKKCSNGSEESAGACSRGRSRSN